MKKDGGKGGAPKSAYEIAMEKLAASDKAKGLSPRKGLSEKQKEEIAEVRAFYHAKLAEREILYRSDKAKAYGDPDKTAEIESAYATDRRRLESDRDGKLAKIRE